MSVVPDRPGLVLQAGDESGQEGGQVRTQEAGLQLLAQLAQALAGRLPDCRVISLHTHTHTHTTGAQ